MTRKRARLRWLTAALLLLLAGCNGLGGIVGTRIEVEGGQRTIEEQVLGSFEHIGEEVYVLAGVRAVDPASGRPSAPRPMTASEQRGLAARRRMEFNLDDVRRFLREGWVGEGNDGLPVVLQEPADARQAALVRDVTEEERTDRTAVMRRIVDTTPGLTGEDGMATVGRVLAARFRQEAEAGMRVQSPDGTWTTK